MRFHSVQLSMSQDEVQSAVNEHLDHGYSLSNVHVMTHGIFATLQTPWTPVDVTVKMINLSDPIDRDDGAISRARESMSESVVAFTVDVSKYVRVPRRLLAHMLQRVTSQMATGVVSVGTVVLIDMSEVLRPLFLMNAASLTLGDGYVTLTGEDVMIEFH
ncbi:hypothetical protein [Sulfoacidibacillus ferrooxidans]|uniref:Uncharacterized protein n=1 Tax=Sulfoacidibacillus ferrooxidans TaxID=2005001 RepID=A0A9X1V810_9BACL|nr:hypothetical protein [Sulfoacidibacillus ferrooxidans]MCI0182450.1 hypothetical protein [Sulfoacidibacillus ferrooxidans]